MSQALTCEPNGGVVSRAGAAAVNLMRFRVKSWGSGSVSRWYGSTVANLRVGRGIAASIKDMKGRNNFHSWGRGLELGLGSGVMRSESMSRGHIIAHGGPQVSCLIPPVGGWPAQGLHMACTGWFPALSCPILRCPALLYPTLLGAPAALMSWLRRKASRSCGEACRTGPLLRTTEVLPRVEGLLMRCEGVM